MWTSGPAAGRCVRFSTRTSSIEMSRSMIIERSVAIRARTLVASSLSTRFVVARFAFISPHLLRWDYAHSCRALGRGSLGTSPAFTQRLPGKALPAPRRDMHGGIGKACAGPLPKPVRMPSRSSPDRRRASRITTAIEARLELAGGEELAAQLENLSVVGLLATV